MKSFLVLLAFVGLAVAFTEKEYQDAFVSWMQKYDTVYAADDFSAKFAAFKSNMDFVQSWNQGGHSHEVELNQFADLTNEEYQRIYLGTHIVVDDSAPVAFEVPNPLAADVDWRAKGYVTPIKDQGQCGSCWSFSAAASAEGAHFKATGNLVSLSEQNLMDCSTSYGNKGCDGGLMDAAFRYIIANKGIDTEASYPYKGALETCRYSAANSGATLRSFSDVAAKSEAALQSALQTVGPVSVAIDASHQSFQLYKTGVYYEAACSTTRLDHGVLAVGYGTDAGEDYYIVKNSWGAKWGMAGYINMARGRANNCGIASAASYPVA
jgi:cathepsin L